MGENNSINSYIKLKKHSQQNKLGKTFRTPVSKLLQLDLVNLIMAAISLELSICSIDVPLIFLRGYAPFKSKYILGIYYTWLLISSKGNLECNSVVLIMKVRKFTLNEIEYWEKFF